MKSSTKAGLLALTWVWASAQAQEVEITGYAGVDNQSFWEDARYADQANGSQTSLMGQLEVYWRGESDRHRFSFAGFGRYDHLDNERTHADIREAYWGYEGDRWDARIGISKVFWGVAESRHLVDVINQTDLVEDIDQEQKLGQPMLNFNLQRNFGRIELYALPRFRERTFPGTDGRFRPALPIDADAAAYESPAGRNHTDYAVRYSHYIGDVDIGFSYFDGTSREPVLLADETGAALVPWYEQMQQVSLDAQLTRGPWLFKLEVFERETSTDRFTAAVSGFEYTFFGVNQGAADVGVLFEHLYDARSAAAPPTMFDDDVFIGVRVALNDANDTSVLAGAIVDTNSRARFVNIEAERRFGARVSAKLRVRAFTSPGEADPIDSIVQDDYLQLAASWFF